MIESNNNHNSSVVQQPIKGLPTVLSWLTLPVGVRGAPPGVRPADPQRGGPGRQPGPARTRAARQRSDAHGRRPCGRRNEFEDCIYLRAEDNAH
eukprot:2253128-Pyramimonas_sp.AAC.2